MEHPVSQGPQIGLSRLRRIKFDTDRCFYNFYNINVITPLSTVSQLSIITAVVAKIKKHVGLTSQMVAYKLATISFTMPELPERKIKHIMSQEQKPAVERVRPPSFAMLLTVELVTTLIVRAGGAGREGEDKRK